MSSSDLAIDIRGVSKAYKIAHGVEKQNTLAEAILARLRKPLRRPSIETFWALKDVSFQVKRGEVVGIIGRNGAGKSTLLKILSRITEPTGGEIDLYGRVGSLLEVGTGFHAELTGRENIFLNGAILGMRKAEIRKQFDAIIDFAGVEKFLDTPVKRYSSGMYVRLAFAVAAHLNPEILIIDEVLAVGDADFQKKCLGKIKDVSASGRTVLFVSHNMAAISQLCSSCVMLSGGRLALQAAVEEVISEYLQDPSTSSLDVPLLAAAPAGAPIVFNRCAVCDADGNALTAVDVMRPFTIVLGVEARSEVCGVEIGLRVSDSLGRALFSSSFSGGTGEFAKLQPGQHCFRVRMPAQLLAPGRFWISIGLHQPGAATLDLRDTVLGFNVEETGSELSRYYGSGYGSILVRLEWERCKPVDPAGITARRLRGAVRLDGA